MSTWSSWSVLPSDGAFCGVTTTTRVAGLAGSPEVLRNWDAAYVCSIVTALAPWSPPDGRLLAGSDEAVRISLAITWAACCW